MPEGLEIEYYRQLAQGALDRLIVRIDAPDAWYLKKGLSAKVVRRNLVGSTFTDARRIGKLLLLDVDRPGRDGPDGGHRDGRVLGLRFGMTGVLEVDDRRAIAHLEYSSPRINPAWIRFRVEFADGGSLVMRDPRRLGGVEADPDILELGPDALALTSAQLRRALEGSVAPLKSRLMDQSRVAGLGNLLVDEILWRSALDPARAAGSLSDQDCRRLHRQVRSTLAELLDRGGSHTGDLMVARVRGASCPKCAAMLLRRTIGGRTTYSCPKHQH